LGFAARGWGELTDYFVKTGICRRLSDVQFRKKISVQQHGGVRWKEGLPERRDEAGS
jgi:hypothetical protein